MEENLKKTRMRIKDGKKDNNNKNTKTVDNNISQVKFIDYMCTSRDRCQI